jgi:hypothetical protein
MMMRATLRHSRVNALTVHNMQGSIVNERKDV